MFLSFYASFLRPKRETDNIVDGHKTYPWTLFPLVTDPGRVPGEVQHGHGRP